MEDDLPTTARRPEPVVQTTGSQTTVLDAEGLPTTTATGGINATTTQVNEDGSITTTGASATATSVNNGEPVVNVGVSGTNTSPNRDASVGASVADATGDTPVLNGSASVEQRFINTTTPEGVQPVRSETLTGTAGINATVPLGGAGEPVVAGEARLEGGVVDGPDNASAAVGAAFDTTGRRVVNAEATVGAELFDEPLGTGRINSRVDVAGQGEIDLNTGNATGVATGRVTTTYTEENGATVIGDVGATARTGVPGVVVDGGVRLDSPPIFEDGDLRATAQARFDSASNTVSPSAGVAGTLPNGANLSATMDAAGNGMVTYSDTFGGAPGAGSAPGVVDASARVQSAVQDQQLLNAQLNVARGFVATYGAAEGVQNYKEFLNTAQKGGIEAATNELPEGRALATDAALRTQIDGLAQAVDAFPRAERADAFGQSGQQSLDRTVDGLNVIQRTTAPTAAPEASGIETPARTLDTPAAAVGIER